MTPGPNCLLECNIKLLIVLQIAFFGFIRNFFLFIAVMIVLHKHHWYHDDHHNRADKRQNRKYDGSNGRKARSEGRNENNDEQRGTAAQRHHPYMRHMALMVTAFLIITILVTAVHKRNSFQLMVTFYNDVVKIECRLQIKNNPHGISIRISCHKKITYQPSFYTHQRSFYIEQHIFGNECS